MEQDLNWESFDRLLVVRRLRQIIGSHWKIQVNFTDAEGYLRNVEKGKFFTPLHAACTSIVASEKGFKGCIGTVRQLCTNLGKPKEQGLKQCHAGFSALAYPIVVDKKFMGSIFADGFILKEQQAQQTATIKNYLKQFYHDEVLLTEHLNEIPVLSEHEVRFLSELIAAIIEEIITVHKALAQSKSELSSLQNQLAQHYSFGTIIGKSKLMQQLFRMVERLSQVDSTVLIQGENGTGKELIARALHYESPRKSHKFVAINCGAFNENLLESELFGHVKGAFTNAIRDKEGLFEAAHQGTIFLDEIGDVPLSMQVKLLRVLQDGSFLPVGSTEEKKSTARVVCATNRDLLKMIDEGTFREDLYYRLNVINVVVPPLRERSEDIPLLVESFLAKFCSKLGQRPKQLSHGTLQKLMNYSWPGNVRELENEIERLVVLGKDSPLLTEDTLSPRIAQSTLKVSAEASPTSVGLAVKGQDLKSAIAELEKQMIAEGLARLKGNKSRLANELGISRANLISKVEKYRLE